MQSHASPMFPYKYKDTIFEDIVSQAVLKITLKQMQEINLRPVLCARSVLAELNLISSNCIHLLLRSVTMKHFIGRCTILSSWKRRFFHYFSP